MIQDDIAIFFIHFAAFDCDKYRTKASGKEDKLLESGSDNHHYITFLPC